LEEGAELGATLCSISIASVVPDQKVGCSNHVGVTNMWGGGIDVRYPPILIILQADLVHYFIYSTRITTDNWSDIKVKVMLRLMISQSVRLGVKFTLELVTRYYFLSEGC
jgi:hypothetical protein